MSEVLHSVTSPFLVIIFKNHITFSVLWIASDPISFNGNKNTFLPVSSLLTHSHSPLSYRSYLDTDSLIVPMKLKLDRRPLVSSPSLHSVVHTLPDISLTLAPYHISEAFSSCKLLIPHEEGANDVVMWLFWVDEDFFTAYDMQDESAWLQYAFPNFNNVVTELFWLFYRIYLNHYSIHFYILPFFLVSNILLQVTTTIGDWGQGTSVPARLVQVYVSRL